MSNGKMGEFNFSIFNNTTKAKKNLVDTPKAYQQDLIYFILLFSISFSDLLNLLIQFTYLPSLPLHPQEQEQQLLL
jgi:hypothetical protein